MEAYNGFSGKERAANGAALRRAIRAGTVSLPTGPCSICNDPEAKVEYHSEDYSKPYNWSPPAAYLVCLACHRNKLHKRFSNPQMWEAFKAHVRRGGFASDLRQPEVARELEQYRAARKSGRVMQLRPLRSYPFVVGAEWWASLSTEMVPNPSLSGCASVGSNFQDGNLGRLQSGVTTEQEAISLLGAEPIARKFDADGSSILKWEYVHGNGFTHARAKMVEAMFDKDHKFVRLVKSANVGRTSSN